MPKTEAELLQQFNELVADMYQLANVLESKKNAKRIAYVKQRLFYLRNV